MALSRSPASCTWTTNICRTPFIEYSQFDLCKFLANSGSGSSTRHRWLLVYSYIADIHSNRDDIFPFCQRRRNGREKLPLRVRRKSISSFAYLNGDIYCINSPSQFLLQQLRVKWHKRSSNSGARNFSMQTQTVAFSLHFADDTFYSLSIPATTWLQHVRLRGTTQICSEFHLQLTFSKGHTPSFFSLPGHYFAKHEMFP